MCLARPASVRRVMPRLGDVRARAFLTQHAALASCTRGREADAALPPEEIATGGDVRGHP